ncbi:MAG: rRNA ((1402)-N(4))-methyltransferase, partial [Firmicutes bacterium]|nr:rRNA ((1402)-N(4))-methyltransferase [Bacillota bacterium]
LDMRMNQDDALTAYTVVNRWSYEELRRILYQYGEERYAPAIASAICRRREEREIATTLELVDTIRGAMPAAALREKQHPDFTASCRWTSGGDFVPFPRG